MIETPEAFRQASDFLPAHRIVLLALHNKRKEGRTHKQVIDVTGLTPNTVTMAKNRLASLELINEHWPERDKRSVKLYLNKKGRREANKVWKAIEAMASVKDSHLKSHTEDQ